MVVSALRGIWFAREATSVGREGNFVVCSISYGCPQSISEYWLDATHNKLRRLLRDKNKKCVLGRVWRLSETLFVGWTQSNGWGLFAKIEDFTHNAHNLAPGFGIELPFVLPSPEVFALLQSQWNDENSDLRFAFRFASLTGLERALHGVQTRLETPQQFACVIKSALRAFGSKWPADLSTARLGFNANGGGGRFTLSEKHPFGIRESAILNHIVRAFEPRQIPDSPDLPLCVRTLTKGSWSRSFSVEVARPSMHDQLEGMLELRAWLGSNWPDGVKHLGKVI